MWCRCFRKKWEPSTTTSLLYTWLWVQCWEYVCVWGAQCSRSPLVDQSILNSKRRDEDPETQHPFHVLQRLWHTGKWTLTPIPMGCGDEEILSLSQTTSTCDSTQNFLWRQSRYGQNHQFVIFESLLQFSIPGHYAVTLRFKLESTVRPRLPVLPPKATSLSVIQLGRDREPVILTAIELFDSDWLQLIDQGTNLLDCKGVTIVFDKEKGWINLTLPDFVIDITNCNLQFKFCDMTSRSCKGGSEWDFVELRKLDF